MIAAWANAIVHGFDEFNIVDSAGGDLDGPDDLSVMWKGLWDDTHLYLYAEVTDDVIINDDTCNYTDDSIEFYIDAQNLDVADFDPANNPGIPAYQFTAIAGNTQDNFCGDRIPDGSTSVFTWGINSYNEDDALAQYPQGADTSVSVIKDDNHYTLEVAFPWEALEDTPANIIARGSMGFGVAVNDDDDLGERDNQAMWATTQSDLWNRSASFPDVALTLGEAVPPVYIGGQGTIGTRTEDSEQQNPEYGPPQLGPGLSQEWYAVSNPGNKDAIDDAFDNNEPIVDPFRAGHGTTWWSGNAAPFGKLVNYPGEVQPPLNNTDNNDYIVRATGEIFIPESGDYIFADGVDDYTYFAIDLDNSGVIGDDPIEVLIDDNTWTGPLRDSNGGGGGWMDVEIDVEDGGQWLAVEFNMGEAGGGDSGVIYWDYNPDAPEGDRLGGGVGFPDIDTAVLVEDAPALVVPDTHLRSEASGLISADLVASITAPRALEFDVNGDTGEADQVVVENPDSSIYTTILDVDGAEFQIAGIGALTNGQSFDIIDADQILGTPIITSVNPAHEWTFDPVDGLVIFGAGLTGDYNGNGELDAEDLDLQAVAIAGGLDPPEFDLTGDGAVNGDDRIFWLHDLKSTWVGDADLNGLFDSGDFVAVFVEGLYETGEAAGWAQGDWNADLVFDSGDFVAAFIDGGYEIGAFPGAVQAVPEPSCLVLALLSLAGLVGLARRRG